MSSYDPTLLPRVRQWQQHHGIDALLVPSGDRFFHEYVAPCDARLHALTGFTGSAGCAVIAQDRAAFFTDGRYTLQAEQELEASLFEVHNTQTTTPLAWITGHLISGMRVALDPWLYTIKQVAHYTTTCQEHGLVLDSLATNPLDACWTTRPEAPRTPLWVYPMPYAGEDHHEKIRTITRMMEQASVDVLWVAAPDRLCWLLNLRGGDIPFSPVPRMLGWLETGGEVHLFLDAPTARWSKALEASHPMCHLHDPQHLPEQVQALAARRARVWIDETRTPYAWYQLGCNAPEAEMLWYRAADPCLAEQARKSPAEITSAKAVHAYDGAALLQCLYAITHHPSSEAPLTECQVASMLTAARQKQPRFALPSFAPIVGANAHGAIIHYHPTPQSDASITAPCLLLIDSGGHYEGGTTDTTRTLVLGTPTPQQQQHYTLVLKAHIALAMAVFPKGTHGMQLDALTRAHLWRYGLEYEHGTGHGVGNCLHVHEGPASISRWNQVPLEAGMLLSNEPGYYLEGQYGIRLENMVHVVQHPDYAPSLCFETITLVPFDRALIACAMLVAEERAWLNDYHRRVELALAPLVPEPVRAWLHLITQPL